MSDERGTPALVVHEAGTTLVETDEAASCCRVQARIPTTKKSALTLRAFREMEVANLRVKKGCSETIYERGTPVGWGNVQWPQWPFPSCNMGGRQQGLYIVQE